MRRFLTKFLVVTTIIIAFHLIAGIFADGRLDPFYLRFTSPRQHSLIIGSSRAAQGLVPEVMNALLEKEKIYEGPLYNFSFTVLHSPFGPYYLRAIKEKLDPKTKNGLFIVSVDPWALAIGKTNVEDDVQLFREKETFIGKMALFNLPVNYEYLLREFPWGWGRIIKDYFFGGSKTILNQDGWLKVDIDMDKYLITKRMERKVDQYEHTLINSKFSNTRIHYLKETIQFLQKHGEVFLVRLPVASSMLQLEEKLAPEFDSIIQGISKKNGCTYFNFIPHLDQYQYTDGNHLFKESGKAISREIMKMILETSRNNVNDKFFSND